MLRLGLLRLRHILDPSGLCEPLDPLSVVPEPNFDFSIGEDVLALAVLLSKGPIAFILATVCPLVDSIPVFFVLLVVPLISPTVSPHITPVPMHVIIQPLPLVATPVDPCVRAMAFDAILEPVTVID